MLNKKRKTFSKVDHIKHLPRPQSLSKGGEENEKKLFVGRAKNNGKAKEREAFASHISISHHALPGNDITATDLYSLQLHCTVPNEGPAEEADKTLACDKICSTKPQSRDIQRRN